MSHSLCDAPCPICAGTKWSEDSTASRMLALPAPYAVVACGSCGQRRLVPQLSERDLKDLYADAYFTSAQAPGGVHAAVKGPASDYGSAVHERWRKFARTVEALKALHPEGRTLLDVGAATGEFVGIARGQGLRADGVELSEFAVRSAREVHDIELDRLSLEQVEKTGFYDFVHLNHVFEHFNDPQKELRHIRRLLAPGGIVYIEVPYQFHIVEKLRFLLRKDEPELTLHSLHHPYFYSPQTIARLLAANGFQVIRQSVFDAIRYEAETLRTKAKKLAWQILSQMSIGNYIEVYARQGRP